MGVWDTGASMTAIGQNVVDDLGLSPIGIVQVHTADAVSMKPTYIVDIHLPNIRVLGIQVVLGTLSQCDVLIGMDIINIGDFVITNKGGNTVMTFRVPSQASVDFVKDENRAAGSPKQSKRYTPPKKSLS
jgi:hypothetical protein